MDEVHFSRNATMYDAVDLDAIPADALVVAGYVDGEWPTFERVVARWPHARHISIATSAENTADVLDVEKGDARLDQVLGWLERTHFAGVARPGIYSSLSSMQGILNTIRAAGWERCRVKVWTAHWTGVPHLCSRRCGLGLKTDAGATQWRGPRPQSRLDESLATPTFLNT
jgi:hypothetical protein